MLRALECGLVASSLQLSIPNSAFIIHDSYRLTSRPCLLKICSMRHWPLPKTAYVLALSVMLSASTTPLLCGSGMATAQQAADCCNMMHSTCRKRAAASPCCQHKPSLPQQPALLGSSPDGHWSPAPRVVMGVLPFVVVAAFSTLPGHLLSGPSVAHSPPSWIRVFLRNSALLI